MFKTVAVCSTVFVAIAGFRLVAAIRSNKYAASHARVYVMNQHERGKFSEIVLPRRTVTAGHTHGVSAANRSSASSAAAAYAYSINRTPFYLSMSASDQRANRMGERYMHWSKDFNAEVRKDKPDGTSMLVLIDVDEHIDDLAEMLHDHNLPAVLYTFQPSVASYATKDDYRFTFDRNNKVVYDVAGGGHYHHAVWDYASDCLTMRKKFLGFTYAKSFFTVEKRYVDPHHQLVLLTPLAKFGLLGCMLSYNVTGNDLKRLEPVQGDFIRLSVATTERGNEPFSHRVSTSRVGMYNAATITLEQDNALTLAANNSESKLSPFQVKSMIPGISNEAATTLVDFHRLKKYDSPVRVVVPTDAVNSYTYNPSFHTDEKPSVKAFMAPLLADAYAPTQSLENDQAMVNGRILKLATPPKNLSEKELGYAREFSDLLVAEVGKLCPVGHEEIVARLSRPSQRRITEEVSFAAHVDKTIKSFMKKEAYQKPSDPRPIATVNGKDKYEYSAYTYALSEALRKCSWYAFGRKPVGIATRVGEICLLAQHIIQTDLSRFDGRINLGLRQLEEIVMRTLFPEECWKDMLRLMRTQHGGKGVSRFGVKYQNGFNRQSGSPETAVFNTICNAFMAYVTFREMGYDVNEAYKKLGIYGGDDGLTPDVDPDLYKDIASKLGHVLEADKIVRGDKGVSFLARMYSPYVWAGDVSTCADISRALSKFHVSVDLNVSAEDKLFEKAYALYLTDANTPIIGDFVCHVFALSGKDGSEYKNLLKIWNSDLPEDEQYPNFNDDGWMDQLVVDQGLSGFRIHDMCSWLSECKSLTDMLQAPSFIEKPELKLAAEPIKLNGDLMPTQDDMDVLIQEYLKKKHAAGDVPAINGAATAKLPDSTDQRSMVNTGRAAVATAQVQTMDDTGSVRRPSNGCLPRPLDNKGSTKVQKPIVRGPQKPGNKGGNRRQRRERERNLLVPSKSHVITPQINGNNGAATNTDDHAAVNEFAAKGFDALTHVLVDALEAYGPNVPSALGEMRYEDIVHNAIDEYFTKPGMSILEPVVEYLSPRHVAINGNNGSATNTDDHAAPNKPVNKLAKQIMERTERKVNPPKKMNKSTGPTGLSKPAPAPVSQTRGRRTGVPRFKRINADKMVINHTELVTLVNGSVGFTSQIIPMQPGLSGSFRWLSTQLSGWEKYRWRKLVAWYETRCSTATPGSVILLADYDAADPAPLDEFTATSYHGATDDVPWKEQRMVMDMNRSKELFIRNGPLAANLDIKTYDFCNLITCSVDGTAVPWGKVFIEYEVELINAQALAVAAGAGGSINGNAGGTTTNPFGTTPIIVPGAYVLRVDTGPSNQVIQLTNLQVGAEYQCMTMIAGTGLTAVSTTVGHGLTARTTLINDAVVTPGIRVVDISTYIATSNTGSIVVSATGTTVDANATFFTWTNLALAAY